MTSQNRSSKLGVGLVLGSIIGGLAAFFLSPKSGKENREMVSKKIQEIKIMIEEKKIQERVKEIYGEVTEEGTRLYTMAREDINGRLDELKKSMDEIDMNRYTTLVNDVIDSVKAETQESGDRIAKLKDYFLNKWGEAKSNVKEDAKEVSKGAKKATKTQEQS